MSRLTVIHASSVDQVAQEIGASSAQVALTWLRQQNIIPIVGARKVSQVKDNLNCVNISLSSEQIEQLNKVSAIELGFPHDFLKQDMPRQLIYGGTFDLIDSQRLLQIK